MIISICGKSGSGKSTFAKVFKEYKGKECIHVDIDKIAHKVLTFDEVKNELRSYFGNDILSNGEVDRKALGKIVFLNEEKMKILSDITWKYMEKEIDKIIYNNLNKIILLDYILLPKTKYFHSSDIRILMKASYEERKRRTTTRDNINDEAFDRRDSASIEYDENFFDYVFEALSIDDIKGLVMSL